ncbi:MAG: NADH:flavin oxidoreductase / NADH oxidase [Proteobacteria bacterium]|nr:MAG: NADH:flavin oxidoreductase / NADH oxidase [Pseudomonadota bacterium]
MTPPLLFTPIAIREVVFKNRVVIAPMATYSAVDGIAQDFHFAHWGRLVLGGASCVFVEATAVTEQGRITNGDLGIWSDAHVPALRRIARFMKDQNVLPGIQLAHAGRKGSMQRPWFGNGALTAEDLARGEKKWDIVAPTAEPMAEGHIVPRQLSVGDLAVLKDEWVAAAKRAREAGFEVLEIHNAHGYLMHQFLSPLSNKRDDAYGGDFAGRTRFPLEVAEAVRAIWPPDKPVFVRVSAVDGLEGGWHMDDTVAYAKELKARGIDVIDCSSGGLFGSATAARVKRTWGFQVPYAERLRREAGIKSMAVGLIIDPLFAEEILQNGRADLVAIARQALVNPCWPQMAEIALGRKAFDAMDDWPVQYGWWLKLRERSIEQIRADEAAARQS